MTWLIRFTSWLRAILHRSRIENDMDAELRFHIEAYAEDLVRTGIPRPEALRRARIEFGGIEQTKEVCRDASGMALFETFAQDLHFGVRMLRKSPGFAAIAILTLALGIAVNTAVFTAFDALVLRPHAVKDPDGLAALFRVTPGGEHYGGFSYPDYLYYRDHNKSFTDLVLFAYGMALTSSDLQATGLESSSKIAGAIGFHLPELLQGGARPIMCFFVSGNYFQMLGTVPLHGRVILPDDDRPESSPVVLMSGNFWQREFHSDPKVVGSVLHLNGVAFIVIGITPRDYQGNLVGAPDLWAPFAVKTHLDLSSQDLQNRLAIVGSPSGRLRSGVTISEAQAELDLLAAQLRTAYPEAEQNTSVSVVSGRNNLSRVDPDGWVVIATAMTAVALVLLIACANVAGLLLARTVSRRKEISVRLALGAGRWRLLRQLLTESTLLGLLAGALGLPLASFLLHALIVQINSTLPSFWGTFALQISPDLRIFAYTLFISCLAGLGFGLTPALQASKVDVITALKDEGSAFGKRVSRSRLRDLLTSGQVTACLVLLISSALLLRGSQNALKVDPGFETRHVAYLETYDPARLHYSQPRLLQLNRSFIEGIAGLPGVRTVAQASRGPIGGYQMVQVAPVGATAPGSDSSALPATGYSYVTPNYFDALSIPIVRGRNFTTLEAEGQAPLVVISEATARRFWPHEDPIGKRLMIGSEKGNMFFPDKGEPSIPNSEVIGVARDVRSIDLRKLDDSYLYLPLSQSRQWTSTLLVRTEGDPAPLLPEFGTVLRRVDVNIPVVAATLNTMVSLDQYFVISRVGGVLASIVGMFGLLMSCMGVHGMVAYSMSQRAREIGIRLALGAQRNQILHLILLDAMRPVLSGIVIGLVASVAITRVIASMLFGLNSFDPISFGGVSLLLAAVAFLAGWFPARHATRVDPVIALRYE